MTAGRFQHHPACSHATEPLLKVGDVLGEGGLDLWPCFHALIFDLDWRLHGVTPIVLPKNAPAASDCHFRFWAK
jgi:hypothetical protein